MELSSAMRDVGGDDLVESSQPTEETFRAQFAAWLGGMSQEARQLAFLLEREEASAPLRRLAADSLNQLLHAADMLPEGTEALGYLETLFAFRLLAAEQSEAAFSAPRLPKPRQPKVPAAPAVSQPAVSAPAVGEAEEATAAPEDFEAQSASEHGEAEVTAEAADTEAEAAEALAGESPAADSPEAEALEASEAEAIAAQAGGTDGERVAVELPAAPEPSELESAEAEASPSAENEAAAIEEVELEGAAIDGVELEAVEGAEDEAPEGDVAAAAAQLEEEPEEEPERAQASDESYAVARRLAPQAALVRAFLGAEDAERLRRQVLEQRGRASRGRSSKEILLASEARVAAASEARAWAESFEAPEFGSTQHDLLRLRTFMKTRVRRTPS